MANKHTESCLPLLFIREMQIKPPSEVPLPPEGLKLTPWNIPSADMDVEKPDSHVLLAGV